MLARIAVLLVFALALGGAVWWGRLSPEDPGQRPSAARSVPVEVAPLTREEVRETVRLTGSLEASARVTAQSRTAGRLVAVAYDVGDTVENGAVVARLDSDEQAAGVRRAEASVLVANARAREARSELERAQRRLERRTRLYERNAISEAELEEAEADLDTAEARLELARAEVQEREADLAAERIRLAEFDVRLRGDAAGPYRVAERMLDPGANVAANTPVLALVVTDPVKAVLRAPERDHVRLERGQRVEARVDALPGHSFHGEVARVAPVIDADSREGRVEIELPNPDGLLRPGMFARVDVEVDVREDRITAPVDAIVRRDGQDGLFLADTEAGEARFVAVDTGVETASRVELTDPDLAGPDSPGKVITAGRHLVDDGTAIDIRRVADDGAPAVPGATVVGEGVSP